MMNPDYSEDDSVSVLKVATSAVDPAKNCKRMQSNYVSPQKANKKQKVNSNGSNAKSSIDLTVEEQVPYFILKNKHPFFTPMILEETKQ